MITYKVKFAEVPFEICERGFFRSLCDDYITEEAPKFSIRIEPDDPAPLLTLHRGVSTNLIDFDTILFHASAIAYKGEGVLFTARSGTGKSTHANYWKEVFGDDVTYVNDDKPFIRPSGRDGENVPRAYGSPWLGKHHRGGNVSAPIKAICVLERGETPSIAEVSPLEVFKSLYVQTFRPAAPEPLARTLELMDVLLRNVKVYKLVCNMDPISAVVAKEGIFGK